MNEKQIENFWKKIDIKFSDKCWEWKRYKNKDGYGRVNINHKLYLSHRLVYELVYGPIQDGLYVLHKCNNPSCCNPKHLYLGTQKDNISDMVCGGRRSNRIGESNGRHKLNWEDIIIMRELYSSGKYYQFELGIKFDIAQTTVSDIIRKRTWKEGD